MWFDQYDLMVGDHNPYRRQVGHGRGCPCISLSRLAASAGGKQG